MYGLFPSQLKKNMKNKILGVILDVPKEIPETIVNFLSIVIF